MHYTTFLKEYEKLPIVLKSKKALKFHCFNYYTNLALSRARFFFAQCPYCQIAILPYCQNGKMAIWQFGHWDISKSCDPNSQQLILQTYIGKPNAVFISSICADVMPSGSKPMDFPVR